MATPLTLDAAGTADVSGQLSPMSEADTYRFDAVAGERYYLQRLQNNYSYGYWRLIGPSGQTVAGPVDQYYTDLQDVAISQTGTYTLVMEGRYYNTDSANYQFRLTRVADPDPTAASLGSLVSGSIDQPGQVRRYTWFFPQMPRQVYFDTLGSSGDGSLTWSLGNASGSVVNARRFDQSNAYDLYGNGVLFNLAAGSYELAIDGTGAFTGNFSFRLVDTAADATAIALDTTVVANLDPATSTRLYRFDGTAV